MARIATVLALGAPLVIVQVSVPATPAIAGGALETVMDGASALLGTAPGGPRTAPPAVATGAPLAAPSWGPRLAAPPAAGSGPPLVAATGAVLVVAGPLEADDPAARGDALAVRVAEGVAARIGAGARAHSQPAQLATARALAGRAGALVYVRTGIAQGDLHVTADVYPSMANAWDRIRNPLPAPTAHAVKSAKVDAQVRTYLAPLILEQATVDRAHHDEGEVLAAGCGDADGDGENEVVLVSAARVALGRVRAGRFVAERTAAWSALAPPLPVPMREPIAEAAIAPGAVVVGLTTRGGLRLTPALSVEAPLAGLPVWDGDDVVCLRPEPSAGAFDGAPVECSLRAEPRPRMAVPAPRFDAFGAAIVGDAQGNGHTVVAVREPSGRLRLKAGDALGVPDGTFGAQLAVGDLDQDGVPEIVTSADIPAGSAQATRADDAIDIATWSPVSSASPGVAGAQGEGTGAPGLPTSPAGPELRGRFHLAAPGGVRALAMCPPGDHGEPALLAVVGNELWIVRAGIAAAQLPTAGEPPADTR
jgi:FG-GAP repeat